MSEPSRLMKLAAQVAHNTQLDLATIRNMVIELHDGQRSLESVLAHIDELDAGWEAAADDALAPSTGSDRELSDSDS